MKIKPFISSGEVFLHEDGRTFEIAPVQVFRLRGGTCFRIGRNVFIFDKDGRIDTIECKPDVEFDNKEDMQHFADTLKAAYEACRMHRGQRPDEPYHQSGSPAFMDEIKNWPDEGATVKPPGHTVYSTNPKKGDSN